MSISFENLKSLHERLIRQNVYPGGICPTEHVLVAYESGILPKAQRELLEEHFAKCSSCREDFIALGRAGRWFREHELRILTGLAAKGAAAGASPWTACPSVGLLYRYVGRDIPESPGGKILLGEMTQHVGRCPDCSRLAGEFRTSMDSPRVSLWDLGSTIALTILDSLRNFGDALVALAQGAGGPASRGAPGYRGAGVPSIDAPVLGEDGKLLVDDAGKPRQCRFEVIQADIKSDGFLAVDLAASDQEYYSQEGRRYDVKLSIRAGGLCLVLPETQIDTQGRAVFTGMLPQAVVVDPLPLTALDITVRRQPPSEQEGGPSAGT